jgi:alpha-beta hydrolase superfamily lysophospholipase
VKFKLIGYTADARRPHIESMSAIKLTQLTPEEEIYQLCYDTDDVKKINLERGLDPEYVFNSRGQKLHVHTYWPDEKSLNTIVIALHGMGSHSNRPMQTYMANQFNANGMAYVCLDFHGHGYSEGVRGLVDSPEFLLDDVVSLLRALYSVESSNNENGPGGFRLKRQAVDAPFFLMGHSMGGSTAIFIGHMLSEGDLNIPTVHNDRQSISAFFRGCLLLCPAIDIKMPPAIVVTALDYLIVPFFPNYSVPELFVARKSSQKLIWSNPMFQDYVTRDGYPANPEGLSYGDPIKFQTASTLVKMASRLQELLSKVRFPFLIFHDPAEQIVLVHGSERLLEKSLTPDVHKSIVMVEGGLHDLLSNSFSLVTEKSIDWIQSQLKIKIFEFDFSVPSSSKTDSKVLVKAESPYFAYVLFLVCIFVFTALLRFQGTEI